MWPYKRLIVLIALTAACTGEGQKDECDAALGLIVADLDRRLETAKSDGEKRAITNVSEATKKYFVGECRELDEAGKACVAKMGEFLALLGESDGESKKCFEQAQQQEEGDPDADLETCLAEIDAQHAKVMGACKDTISALEAEVSARGQADWEAKNAKD